MLAVYQPLTFTAHKMFKKISKIVGKKRGCDQNVNSQKVFPSSLIITRLGWFKLGVNEIKSNSRSS